MIIREINKNDVDKWHEMNVELDKESPYMLYEEGERTKNIDVINGMIDGAVSGKNLILVAEDNGKLVGLLIARIGNSKRVKHEAYIVVGIRKAYRNQGIGTEFFKQLNEWAVENRLRRLELIVVSNNENALHLYEKFGFEIEGVKRDSFCLNGIYLDQYYMGKILKY